MQNILIAGCGYVGTQLGLTLANQGRRVFGLRRSAGGLPSPIEPISADVTQPGSLRHLPDGIDCLVYAASPGASHDEAYRQSYVEGLDNLLRAPSLVSTPPARVLFVGSTAVYEQDGGQWVDEESPTTPTHFSGKRLLEAEARLARSGLPTVALRCGGIYGPGRTRLIDRVRRGEARYDPMSPRYGNRIHRDDVAGVLEHLMTLESPASLYLGVDHEPAELRVVFDWLARRMGAPQPLVSRTSPEGRSGRSNKRCKNTRLVASGYTFRYPTFREGYESLLDSTVTRAAR